MPRLCRCGAIVDKKCDKCKPTGHARTTKQRGYGSDWERLRLIKLANDPLCEQCLIEERVTPALDVHHIITIEEAPHLRLVMDNLMSICRPCHAKIGRHART